MSLANPMGSNVQREKMTSRRKWLVVASALLIAALILLAGLRPVFEGIVRERVLATLRERFASDVEFSSLRVSLVPGVRVTCDGLVMRHEGRTDVPPLITIERLSVKGSLVGLLRSPPHFRSVHLAGLKIQVPPRNGRTEASQAPKTKEPQSRLSFLIDEVTSENARLDVLRKQLYKPTLTWEIHHLRMQSVSPERPASFETTLSNPRPIGEIETEGQFGPWQKEAPSLTPVRGRYAFSHADLSSFHGIAGMLASQGRFDGTLDHIGVDGTTTTPDFMVNISGHSLPLETQFSAVVDGTNGNTILNSLHARFLHSALVAKGEIVRTSGLPGRVVSLDVAVDDARVQDLLYLAVKGEPPMTGVASLRTKFELPHGEEDIAERIKLNGRFGVGTARFAEVNVQRKVDELSRRGLGAPKDAELGTAVSRLRGTFTLEGGVVDFSNLMFDVEGASVQLRGKYNLMDEQLDFHGVLRLRARLSQTTTGVKSFFLKALDPWFAGKDAGTILPIKVTGTRTNPSFGVELGPALTRKPSATAEQMDNR